MSERRTYDAWAVDTWLALHLSHLEGDAARLQHRINRETSLRLRTIEESRLIEAQHQIDRFKALIENIEKYGPNDHWVGVTLAGDPT